MMIFRVFIIVALIARVFGSFEPVQVMCEVNGKMIPAIVDTGAEISVMSTSCARRCDLWNAIDTKHSGRAIGVGSSDIIGGIEGLGIRIGPLSFQNKISILRNSNHRCDFIIGLDILKRFNCDILLRERVVKMYVRGNEVRIPLVQDGQAAPTTDLSGHFQAVTKQQQQLKETNGNNNNLSPSVVSATGGFNNPSSTSTLPSSPSSSSAANHALRHPAYTGRLLDEEEDEEFEDEVEYDHYMSQRPQSSSTTTPSSSSSTATSILENQRGSRRMEYVVNRHCYDEKNSRSHNNNNKNNNNYHNSNHIHAGGDGQTQSIWSGNRIASDNAHSDKKSFVDPDLQKYLHQQQSKQTNTQKKQKRRNHDYSQNIVDSRSDDQFDQIPLHKKIQAHLQKSFDTKYKPEGETDTRSDHTSDEEENNDHQDEDDFEENDYDNNSNDFSLDDDEDYEHFHERHRDRSISMAGV